MEVHPHAWMFFVPFIFIVTFIMINLIIAIVVDAMNEIKDTESETLVGEIHTSEDHTKIELEKLRVEIQELKTILLEQKTTSQN
jgi:voltage-gated sodium channel